MNPSCEAESAVKVIVAVCERPIESVASVAVKIGLPGVTDLTVKVTIPLPEEGPEAAEMVSTAPPRLEARSTDLPATGFELMSRSMTVTVESVAPSAKIEEGDAETDEVVTFTAGALKVMSMDLSIVTESLVSVAVSVELPTKNDFIVKVATPVAEVTTELGEMVS